jgi:hypothetical protein
VIDCRSGVEPTRIFVALAVRMGPAPAGHLRRPRLHRRLHHRRPLLLAVSTTTSITEKIRVLSHTSAIGRSAQLPVNTTHTLTWSLPSQYLILGGKLRIPVTHSVPSLPRCTFATMRITSPLSIRGGLLGRRSFSVSAALARVALGLVSLDNFRVTVDQKRCFISRS